MLARAAARCVPPTPLELLESRTLLAATLVNFQPAASTVPAGYLVDKGDAYGLRSNGRTYGFDTAITANTRDRANHDEADDDRYDTFIMSQAGGNWNLLLSANQRYQVRVVMGDPSDTDGYYALNVETASLVINGDPKPGGSFFEGSADVTVGADGKLTLSNGTGASNNKLAFVQVWPFADTAATVAPSGVTATRTRVNGTLGVDVRWTDNAAPDANTAEIGFKIERKTGAGGTWAEIGTASSNTSHFADTAVAANTTYFYRVRAYNVRGNSAYSAEASATTLAAGNTAVPYPTTAPALPTTVGASVTIQAEDYDIGGEGVSYNDSTGNNGRLHRFGDVDIVRGPNRTGRAVGEFTTDTDDSAEWIDYTINVPTAGNYTFDASVASRVAGGLFHVEFGNQQIKTDLTGPITVPNTGSNYTFQTVSRQITLPAGTQTMRVAANPIDTDERVARLDWFRFTRVTSDTKPAAATNPKATPTSPTTTTLTWNDAATNETGYRIDRYSTTYTGLNHRYYLPANSTSFEVPVQSHVSFGTNSYHYRIYATNAAGQSVAAYAAETLVFANQSGALGDGVTDDQPALQAAIDAAPDDAVLVLDAGKTYRLNKGLLINKPLNIEGRADAAGANRSKLLLNASNSGENIHVAYNSQYATPYKWEQTVTAGQRTFGRPEGTPGTFAPDLQVNDIALLELGDDPYDGATPGQWWMSHYTATVKVVSRTDDSITVASNLPGHPEDGAPPYNILDGEVDTDQHRGNQLTEVTKLIDNVWVSKLQIDHTATAAPDQQILMNGVQNALIQNVSGRFANAVSVRNSDDITVRNFTGELVSVLAGGYQGRFLTGAQSDRTRAENIDVTTAANRPVVFLESWDRGFSAANVDISLRVPYSAATFPVDDRAPIFMYTAGSQANVEDVVIDNAGYDQARLVDTGGGPAEYDFGYVKITGPVFSAPMPGDNGGNFLDVLEAHGQVYDSSAMSTASNTITLNPNTPWLEIPLVQGVVRRVTVQLSTYQGVQTLAVANSNGQGLVWGPESQQQTSFELLDHNYASTFNAAAPGGPTTANMHKKLAYATNGTLPIGTTLTYLVEYWPRAS